MSDSPPPYFPNPDGYYEPPSIASGSNSVPASAASGESVGDRNVAASSTPARRPQGVLPLLAQNSEYQLRALMNSVAAKLCEMESALFMVLEFVPRGQLSHFMGFDITTEDFDYGTKELSVYMGRSPRWEIFELNWFQLFMSEFRTWGIEPQESTDTEAIQNDSYIRSCLEHGFWNLPIFNNLQQICQDIANMKPSYDDYERRMYESEEWFIPETFVETMTSEEHPLINALDLCCFREEYKDMTAFRKSLVDKLAAMASGASERRHVWSKETSRAINSGVLGRDMASVMRSKGRGSALREAISADEPWPESEWGLPLAPAVRSRLVGKERSEREVDNEPIAG